ncbi:uncharacterized protein LOC135287255 [Passer domesticus]|uniref:uncharacterized protein LOC135287255 n=1 Tax=Passer domesticus TaxID=48849 RepID=UPI0030FE6A12
MTKKMWSLTESLVELLQDTDGEIVCMTVMLLSFIILDNDTLIAGPITLQLVEALLPLFDHDNNQVQVLSILLFRTLVTLPQKKEKKALKTPLRQSLLPLFFHCHDENRLVAQVSQETLLCVVEFLKRRDLEKQLKNKKLWKFTKCLVRRAWKPQPHPLLHPEAVRALLQAPVGPSREPMEPRPGGALAEDRSRAAEHLRRALPYLRNPQESLRAAAIRFTALEHLAEDISSAVSDAALQTLDVLRALQSKRYSVFQRLQDQLCRARWTRPRLSGLGCLRCWSSAES